MAVAAFAYSPGTRVRAPCFPTPLTAAVTPANTSPALPTWEGRRAREDRKITYCYSFPGDFPIKLFGTQIYYFQEKCRLLLIGVCSKIYSDWPQLGLYPFVLESVKITNCTKTTIFCSIKNMAALILHLLNKHDLLLLAFSFVSNF